MPYKPTQNEFSHRPVLLEECLTALKLQAGATVVDGTVGGGGHAAAILERTAPDGRLIGLDLDGEAIRESQRRLESFGERVTLIQQSFRNLDAVLAHLGVPQADAVLLDLGVSSHQLDSPRRGFRFATETSEETPLDMRMDQQSGTTAADLLRRAGPEQLEKWFSQYADLPGSRKLARAIVEARQRTPLRTVADLRAVIAEARIGRGRRHDPATLVFQALRMAVNDEANALADGLEAAIESLRVGGRLAVLSYHSGEDRIVKNQLRSAARGCSCPPRTPVCICGEKVRLRVVTRKPISAGADELRENPRARSARLRIAERVAEAS
ncbi:MAG: 16S rRNA (cytosine(1402)-N(4))-methyltransferase RsmH [Deltaproteobacteria bacterium]|nr:16S rRNA (cytosine(1402)-N(4))-methyltransferase RsmH [Deltaproteobacteria bacterium]